MAGLCASLACVGLLFNIPVGHSIHHSGWRVLAGNQQQPDVRDISSHVEALSFGVPANEEFLSSPADNDIAVEPISTPINDTRETGTDYTTEEPNWTPLPVWDAPDLMPNIEGGIGAYYINIEYPQKAISQGVSGRLVLHFVVEPDGSTSNVRIHKPNHPLLDSAAVQALRRTAFIPGTKDGQAVRVRMSLPVSFEIVDIAPPDTTNT